jgi:hypothetical protein
MGRWVRLAVVTVVVLSGVAGAAGAAGTEAPATATDRGQLEEGPGPRVAAFTGATSAATGAAVNQGMWTAAFDRADPSERPRMVRERARRLEHRMDAMERDRAAMNDSTGAAAAARRATLDSRASALAAASADTAAVAERRGHGETAAALRGLQRRAERMDRELSPGRGAGPGDGPDGESRTDDRTGPGPATDGRDTDSPGDRAGERGDRPRDGVERG